MSQARKLADETLPVIPVDGSPSVRGPEITSLPPLPHGPALRELSAPSDGPSALTDRPAASQGSKKKKKKGGFGRSVLLLFVIGFLSFGTAAGLTAGIVLGNVEIKTGKVKEVLHDVKTFIQQMRS